MAVYVAKDIQQLIPNDAILFFNTLGDLIQTSNSKNWNADAKQQIEKASNIDCWLLTYFESPEIIGLDNDSCSIETVYSNNRYYLYHIIK